LATAMETMAVLPEGCLHGTVKSLSLLTLVLTLAACTDEQERIAAAERVAKLVCACNTPGCVTYELDRAKKTFDVAAISDKAKRKINASREKMEACVNSLPARAQADHEEGECRKEKRVMIDKCMPGCNAQPDLVGEAYDACLQDCAQKEFGKPMPMCSR
jgi:hypothetical protein